MKTLLKKYYFNKAIKLKLKYIQTLQYKYLDKSFYYFSKYLDVTKVLIYKNILKKLKEENLDVVRL